MYLYIFDIGNFLPPDEYMSHCSYSELLTSELARAGLVQYSQYVQYIQFVQIVQYVQCVQHVQHVQYVQWVRMYMTYVRMYLVPST